MHCQALAGNVAQSEDLLLMYFSLQSLAQLLCEMREVNKSQQFEVDDLRQKLSDAQGDIKVKKKVRLWWKCSVTSLFRSWLLLAITTCQWKPVHVHSWETWGFEWCAITVMELQCLRIDKTCSLLICRMLTDLILCSVIVHWCLVLDSPCSQISMLAVWISISISLQNRKS